MKQAAWTEEEAALVLPMLLTFCEMREYRSAACVFCRPNDAELETLISVNKIISEHEGYMGGRNIYSFHWWSDSLSDSVGLARQLLATIPVGGRFAWHFGEDKRVFTKKEKPCQPQ